MKSFREFCNISSSKEDINESIKYYIDNKYNIKLLNEGVLSGISPTNSRSREQEYNKFYKNSNLTLIKTNISNYNMFNVGNTYYLTDNERNYLGFIQLEPFNYKSGSYKILESSSKLTGGFYKIIFKILLNTIKQEVIPSLYQS